MKKIMLCLLISLTTTVCFSQKIEIRNVSISIKNTFNKLYTKAKEIQWSLELKNFEVAFEIDEHEMSVLFDSTGTILLTEVELENGELATQITNYIKEHYSKAKIKDASKITDNKGNVTYSIELKNKEILFSSEGIFIKEIIEDN